MKIYLVLSASDITGRHGYGRALLDMDFPRSLVTFADSAYARRASLFPYEDDPVWDLKYKPPVPIKRREVSK